MMAGPLEKGRSLAHQVQIPEMVVTDWGHKAGRRMRDYEGFPTLKAAGMPSSSSADSIGSLTVQNLLLHRHGDFSGKPE